MADNNNGTSGLGWFLAGLGIGAIVGVLYAPKSGRETREDIVNSAIDAKERAAALAQQGIDAANGYVEQGKNVASDYADRGKEYYEKGRSQWTQYVEKLAAALDAGKEAYASKVEEHVG
jgi:gas vesicle protein